MDGKSKNVTETKKERPKKQKVGKKVKKADDKQSSVSPLDTESVEWTMLKEDEFAEILKTPSKKVIISQQKQPLKLKLRNGNKVGKEDDGFETGVISTVEIKKGEIIEYLTGTFYDVKVEDDTILNCCPQIFLVRAGKTKGAFDCRKFKQISWKIRRSCKPNSKLWMIKSQNSNLRLVLVSTKNINKFEEVTIPLISKKSKLRAYLKGNDLSKYTAILQSIVCKCSSHKTTMNDTKYFNSKDCGDINKNAETDTTKDNQSNTECEKQRKKCEIYEILKSYKGKLTENQPEKIPNPEETQKAKMVTEPTNKSLSREDRKLQYILRRIQQLEEEEKMKKEVESIKTCFDEVETERNLVSESKQIVKVDIKMENNSKIEESMNVQLSTQNDKIDENKAVSIVVKDIQKVLEPTKRKKPDGNVVRENNCSLLGGNQFPEKKSKIKNTEIQAIGLFAKTSLAFIDSFRNAPKEDVLDIRYGETARERRFRLLLDYVPNKEIICENLNSSKRLENVYSSYLQKVSVNKQNPDTPKLETVNENITFQIENCPYSKSETEETTVRVVSSPRKILITPASNDSFSQKQDSNIIQKYNECISPDGIYLGDIKPSNIIRGDNSHEFDLNHSHFSKICLTDISKKGFFAQPDIPHFANTDDMSSHSFNHNNVFMSNINNQNNYPQQDVSGGISHHLIPFYQNPYMILNEHSNTFSNYQMTKKEDSSLIEFTKGIENELLGSDFLKLDEIYDEILSPCKLNHKTDVDLLYHDLSNKGTFNETILSPEMNSLNHIMAFSKENSWNPHEISEMNSISSRIDGSNSNSKFPDFSHSGNIINSVNLFPENDESEKNIIFNEDHDNPNDCKSDNSSNIPSRKLMSNGENKIENMDMENGSGYIRMQSTTSILEKSTLKNQSEITPVVDSLSFVSEVDILNEFINEEAVSSVVKYLSHEKTCNNDTFSKLENQEKLTLVLDPNPTLLCDENVNYFNSTSELLKEDVDYYESHLNKQKNDLNIAHSDLNDKCYHSNFKGDKNNSTDSSSDLDTMESHSLHKNNSRKLIKVDGSLERFLKVGDKCVDPSKNKENTQGSMSTSHFQIGNGSSEAYFSNDTKINQQSPPRDGSKTSRFQDTRPPNDDLTVQFQNYHNKENSYHLINMEFNKNNLFMTKEGLRTADLSFLQCSNKFVNSYSEGKPTYTSLYGIGDIKGPNNKALLFSDLCVQSDQNMKENYQLLGYHYPHNTENKYFDNFADKSFVSNFHNKYIYNFEGYSLVHTSMLESVSKNVISSYELPFTNLNCTFNQYFQMFCGKFIRDKIFSELELLSIYYSDESLSLLVDEVEFEELFLDDDSLFFDYYLMESTEESSCLYLGSKTPPSIKISFINILGNLNPKKLACYSKPIDLMNEIKSKYCFYNESIDSVFNYVWESAMNVAEELILTLKSSLILTLSHLLIYSKLSNFVVSFLYEYLHCLEGDTRKFEIKKEYVNDAAISEILTNIEDATNLLLPCSHNSNFHIVDKNRNCGLFLWEKVSNCINIYLNYLINSVCIFESQSIFHHLEGAVFINCVIDVSSLGINLAYFIMELAIRRILNENSLTQQHMVVDLRSNNNFASYQIKSNYLPEISNLIENINNGLERTFRFKVIEIEMVPFFGLVENFCCVMMYLIVLEFE